MEKIVYSSNLAIIGDSAFSGDIKLMDLPLTKDSNNKTILLKTLTGIGANAFSSCELLGFDDIAENNMTNLMDLLGESNVTTIGANAFKGCSYLTGYYTDSFTNSSGLENSISIGNLAFYGTNIKKGKYWILEKDNVKTYFLSDEEQKIIKANEFANVTLFIKKIVTVDANGEENIEEKEITELEIPSSVTRIENNAFNGCTTITKVTLPESLTTIGTSAFNGCNSLKTVINNSVVSQIPNSLFNGCSALENCGDWSKITLIGESAFNGTSNLKDFTFGSKLMKIMGTAFQSSGLQNIEFPSSLEGIGAYSFRWCHSLKTLNLLRTNLETLPVGSFQGCPQLSSVIFNSSLKKIGDASFADCAVLTSVVLPNSLERIGGQSFRGCKQIDTIVIPDNVTSIGWEGFRGCIGLITVDGCLNVESLGSTCFGDCTSLQNISGCTKVRVIQNYTFQNCWDLMFEGLDLEWENLTSIGNRAFLNCQSLKLDNGETLTLYANPIASDAFSGCPLKEQIISST